MKVDDLFSPIETSASEQLAKNVEVTSDILNDSKYSLMLYVPLDYWNIKGDNISDSDKENFLRYVNNAKDGLYATIAASRTAELASPSFEIVTNNHDIFIQLRDDMGLEDDAVWDPHIFSTLYFRFSIKEDFRNPVQLIRFISELFDNTRNPQYYSSNNSRTISIFKSNDKIGYDIYNIGFKDIVVEKRHEKKHKRHNFSERESFKNILKICYYMMLDRRSGLDIYNYARYKFRCNLDIELMSTARSALSDDNIMTTELNMSNVANIQGFSFMSAKINLLDFHHSRWWSTAAFVFYSTYHEQQRYEFYDFDSSGHRTEHANILGARCDSEGFFNFEFGLNTIFDIGFMLYDNSLNDLYFVMAIKLKPIAVDIVNDGAAYETAFIYKERIKDPDFDPKHNVSVKKFHKMIYNAVKSEYKDCGNHFSDDLYNLLDVNYKKTIAKWHSR